MMCMCPYFSEWSLVKLVGVGEPVLPGDAAFSKYFCSMKKVVLLFHAANFLEFCSMTHEPFFKICTLNPGIHNICHKKCAYLNLA